MSTTRLLTAFGLIDIAVGIAVWTATDNALLGIVIIVVGIMLLVVPAVRGARPGQTRDQPPSTFEGQPPEKFEGEPSATKARRRDRSDGALDKERAQQQRLQDETAASIKNVEDRPPATGA